MSNPSLHCRTCKALLHYKQIGGMRLYRKVGERQVYDAYCPACKKHTEEPPSPNRAVRDALDKEMKSRAGCVALRRARTTGVLVGLYKSAEAGMESGEGCEWSTVCEDHGGVVGHSLRTLADRHLSHPESWCPTCQERP